MSDLIDRQAAIETVDFECGEWRGLAGTIVNGLKNLPAANRWIPCKERLPQEDELVLVTDYAGCQHVWNITRTVFGYLGGLCWENECGYYVELDDAVAWMPLPEPYKEEEGEL